VTAELGRVLLGKLVVDDAIWVKDMTQGSPHFYTAPRRIMALNKNEMGAIVSISVSKSIADGIPCKAQSALRTHEKGTVKKHLIVLPQSDIEKLSNVRDPNELYRQRTAETYIGARLVEVYQNLGMKDELAKIFASTVHVLPGGKADESLVVSESGEAGGFETRLNDRMDAEHTMVTRHYAALRRLQLAMLNELRGFNNKMPTTMEQVLDGLEVPE